MEQDDAKVQAKASHCALEPAGSLSNSDAGPAQTVSSLIAEQYWLEPIS